MTRSEADEWIRDNGHWLFGIQRIPLVFHLDDEVLWSKIAIPPSVWRMCTMAGDTYGWKTTGWLPEKPWKEVGRG